MAVRLLFGLIPFLNVDAQSQNLLVRGQNKQDGIEKLLAECYYNHLWNEDQNDPCAPSFLFEASISRATTLNDLAKIQRRVRRHLALTLTYRHIEFDSSGLSALSVDAISRFGTYRVYNVKITDRDEYGIYEVSYRGLRRWFVGSRSEWPESFHALLTCR